MYFAYAWPKVLASGTHHRGDDPVVALELAAGLGCLAVVFASSVEIWSTGQHRRLVGRHARDAEAVAEEGAYLAASWRGGGASMSSGRTHRPPTPTASTQTRCPSDASSSSARPSPWAPGPSCSP